MVKRRKEKPTSPSTESEPAALPEKKCEGYCHHFSYRPIGQKYYICECGVFLVTVKSDGTPVEMEPIPTLNPDNHLIKASDEYREV